VSLKLSGNNMHTNHLQAIVRDPPSLLRVVPSTFVAGAAFSLTTVSGHLFLPIPWFCFGSGIMATRTILVSDTIIVCVFDNQLTESFFVRVCPGPSPCSHQSFASNMTFVSNSPGSQVSIVSVSTDVPLLPNSQVRIFADVHKFPSSSGIRCRHHCPPGVRLDFIATSGKLCLFNSF
jgi:hypothetical protein